MLYSVRKPLRGVSALIGAFPRSFRVGIRGASGVPLNVLCSERAFFKKTPSNQGPLGPHLHEGQASSIVMVEKHPVVSTQHIRGQFVASEYV
jgi:hypothetical protein